MYHFSLLSNNLSSKGHGTNVKSWGRIAGGYLVVGGSVSDEFGSIGDLRLVVWRMFGFMLPEFCCRKSYDNRKQKTLSFLLEELIEPILHCERVESY